MNNSSNFVDTKPQELILQDRKRLSVSGIVKLVSLNEESFLLKTNKGMLLIEGKKLEMSNLDINTGNISIIGEVNSLVFIDKQNNKEEKEGFFKKLFK